MLYANILLMLIYYLCCSVPHRAVQAAWYAVLRCYCALYGLYCAVLYAVHSTAC